jgi:hypothetical protein
MSEMVTGCRSPRLLKFIQSTRLVSCSKFLMYVRRRKRGWGRSMGGTLKIFQVEPSRAIILKWQELGPPALCGVCRQRRLETVRRLCSGESGPSVERLGFCIAHSSMRRTMRVTNFRYHQHQASLTGASWQEHFGLRR